MNDHDAFDQSVADLVANEGATGVPAGAVDELITATSTVRPLPRWLALIKEPPMRRSSAVAVGSPTVRLAAIALSTILLLVLAGGAVAGAMQLIGQPALVVSADGSGEYRTISEAVAAAGDGDTVLVKPGTYSEAVVVSGKDIEIRGDGSVDDVVVEAAAADLGIPDFEDSVVAFYFEDTSSTVSQLTVTGPDDSYALVANGPGAAPTLTKIEVPFARAADAIGQYLYWLDGASGTLTQSTVGGTVSIGEGATPILSENTLDACIWIDGRGARPVLDTNDIFGCPEGFLVFVGEFWNESSIPASAEITGNTFRMDPVESGQHVGNIALIIGRSDEPTVVAENEFIGNKTAIGVRSFAAAAIDDNIVRDGETGIWVEGDATSLSGNRLLDNSLYGLLIHSSPSVEDNTIERNLIGINIGSSAAPDVIGNTFCGNETNINGPGDDTTALDDNEVCDSAD